MGACDADRASGRRSPGYGRVSRRQCMRSAAPVAADVDSNLAIALHIAHPPRHQGLNQCLLGIVRQHRLGQRDHFG